MTDSTTDPIVDALRSNRHPERPHYALGTLLTADDFLAEQTYHRARLARLLAYLFGPGTVAGLRALFKPATPAALRDPDLDEVHVNPGLALDAYGRLIEVPRLSCVRLRKWFNAQDAGRRAISVQQYADAHPDQPPDAHAIAWLFLRFHPYPDQVTPVLAAGPFDATNSVAPARTRDGHELRLFLAGAADEPTFPRVGTTGADRLIPRPAPQLPSAGSDRIAALHEHILDRWEQPTPSEKPPGADGWLLLARVDIPTVQNGAVHEYDEAHPESVLVDNYVRPFVHGAAALALHTALPQLARTPTL